MKFLCSKTDRRDLIDIGLPYVVYKVFPSGRTEVFAACPWDSVSAAVHGALVEAFDTPYAIAVDVSLFNTSRVVELIQSAGTVPESSGYDSSERLVCLFWAFRFEAKRDEIAASMSEAGFNVQSDTRGFVG